MLCMTQDTFRPADIIAQVRTMLSADRHWTRLLAQAPNLHLAILVEPFLTYILEGRKTIESRFTKNRVSPFERVQVGDLLLLKRSSGPVVGMARVAHVEFLTLSQETWPRVHALSEQLCADAGFWTARADKHYASLMHIGDVRPLRPFDVRKTDRRAWVILRGSDQLELGPLCV